MDSGILIHQGQVISGPLFNESVRVVTIACKEDET
jgi:hypothetical protein